MKIKSDQEYITTTFHDDGGENHRRNCVQNS